ncbi:MBL fold metallo-hydrolase [Pontibacter sp. MBLB2868]|uniref:MBL fold metallo-hydrolase n=1 Tax=Pontibacter sp. MBLB2868 TaxID=3451555 RepID=UPI003F74CEC4
MHLYFTSLNSGSNGNCYYIGNDREAVLVDVGLSCRETEKRMKRLGLSMRKVKAVFISHEHSDHIKGVPVLARKYQLPVYITAGTLHNARMDFSGVRTLPFQAEQPVQVGDLTVMPFEKLHDAYDPHSFVIAFKDVKVGVFTDLGAPCKNLIRHFGQCHAAFLEANYDEDLLERGSYPYYLKKRISGGRGHLSNRQALALFSAYKPAFMSHLLLAHLSKDNNCPNLVKQLFTAQAEKTEVEVASRYIETRVYSINCSGVLHEMAALGGEVDMAKYDTALKAHQEPPISILGKQLQLFE